MILLLSVLLPFLGALFAASAFQNRANRNTPVVSETPDTSETLNPSETLDTPETLDTSETPDTPETLDTTAQEQESTDSKQTFSAYLRMLLPTAAAESAVLLICSCIAQFLMFHDNRTLSFIALLICVILPYFYHYLRLFTPHAQMANAVRRISAAALILLAAETLVFNWKSMTTGKTDEIIKMETLVTDGSITTKEDCYEITGSGTLKFNTLPDGTNGLILKIEREESSKQERFFVSAWMMDGNRSKSYYTVRQDYTYGKDSYSVSFTPYEKLYSFMLSFSNISQPITVTSARAVSALPLHFSLLRFILLLSVCAACILVCEFKLYRCTVSDQTMLRDVLVYAATALTVLSAFCFMTPDHKLIEYDPDYNYSGENPYVQAFDALYHGRVDLNIIPDPALETLNNVYDRSEREEAGVDYKWDFAYKDGKYYSYFGIVPVVTLYFPIFWMTGKIPTVPYANAFFGIFALLFLCLLLHEAVRRMFPKANLLLFVCMLPVSAGTVGLYSLLNVGNSYNLAVTAGMCWLLMSIWLGLTACGTKKTVTRFICFAGSGLALALCAGSRPTMSAGAAVLLPLFLGVLLRKKESLVLRLGSAACFAVPLFAGLISVFWYNNARFGSPLDFGAAYQLTVSDVHANTLNLNLLPEAIGNYFFLMPRALNTFPYFEVNFYDFSNSGKMLYAAPCIGAFVYPLLLLGTLFIPYGITRKKDADTLTGNITALQKNAFLIICFAGAVCMAWLDFCMGGIIQRYTADFLPLLTIGSILTILYANQKAPSKFRYILTVGVAAATFAIVWLLELELTNGNLSNCCPNLYDTVKNLIQFWR